MLEHTDDAISDVYEKILSDNFKTLCKVVSITINVLA